MITVVILTVIGIAIGVIFSRLWKVKMMSRFFIPIIGGWVGFLAGIFVSLLIGGFFPSEYVLKKEIKLMPIPGINDTSKAFYLSNNQLDYFLLVRTKDGIRACKFRRDDDQFTVGFQPGIKEGLARIYETRFFKRWYAHFGISSPLLKYEIFIPPNSIRDNFRIYGVSTHIPVE